MYDDHVLIALFTWIVRYKPSLAWIFIGNTRVQILQQLSIRSGFYIPESETTDPYAVHNLLKWIEDNHD